MQVRGGRSINVVVSKLGHSALSRANLRLDWPAERVLALSPKEQLDAKLDRASPLHVATLEKLLMNGVAAGKKLKKPTDARKNEARCTKAPPRSRDPHVRFSSEPNGLDSFVSLGSWLLSRPARYLREFPKPETSPSPSSP